MTDAQEPTGATQRARVTPAPHPPRFDELFAAAIQEQLSEQRTLNELLSRVESTLRELRDPPPFLQLLESIPDRLTQLQTGLLHALAVRDDVDRLGTEGLLRRLEALRTEIDGRLSARDQQAESALAEAIEALRRQGEELESVRAALTQYSGDAADRVASLVDSSITSQQAAAATMENAAARIETLQHEMRDRLAAIVAASVSDLEAAGGKLAADQDRQLRAMIDQAATRLAQAQEAGVVELTEAAAGVTRVAEALGPAIATTAREVRTAMREAVDEDRGVVEAALAARTDQMRASITAEVQNLSDAAAGVLAALQDKTESIGAVFGERIDAAGRSMADIVAEVREALVVTAEQDRRQIRDALIDLGGSAKHIADGLQTSLEQTEAARTASAAELASVQRSVADLREALERTARASGDLIDKVVARLEDAAEHHVGSATSASSEVAERTRTMEEAASALWRVAASIEPALAETAGEVLTALRQTAKQDRAQMRDALARIQQSADRMGGSLEARMVRHIDAVHAASATELSKLQVAVDEVRTLMQQTVLELRGSVADDLETGGSA